MEVIVGTLHAQFPMDEASRLGQARRHAAQLAQDCGFDETAAGRLALVVTELATNLLRHAREGRLWLAGRPVRGEVEVLAVDAGPGIPDLERSLADGFSTGGTPGTGLGAVRRLADHFDIHSGVPGGTIVLARVRSAGARRPIAAAAEAICVGGISLAAPGESVCGDGWGFALDGERAAMIVVDGLGHGPEAARAADEALAEFDEAPMLAPSELLRRTHERLRSTRGAAVATLQADAASGELRSVGAGNVVGRVISGVSDRVLLTQHGTAGVAIRTPQEAVTAWPPHALVVLATDGVETRWPADLLTPVLGRDPSIAAALLLRDHCRGRDDATVAVLRRKD